MTIYTAVTMLFICLLFLAASLTFAWRQLLRLGHAHDHLSVIVRALDKRGLNSSAGFAGLKSEVIAVINLTQDRMDKLEKLVDKETTWR